MKGAVARIGADAVVERVTEGRPASRWKSAVTALAAGAGVGVLVYRVLRSGESDDGDSEGGDRSGFSSPHDG